MAKSLLKHSEFSCTSLEVEEGEDAPLGCEMIPLLMDIINTQNHQIIDMESVLEEQRAPKYADCQVEMLGELDVGRKMQGEEEVAGAYEHGLECKPCESVGGECEIKVKIDFYSSELGKSARLGNLHRRTREICIGTLGKFARSSGVSLPMS